MSVKKAFEKANPAIWHKAQNNPELAADLRSLVERSADIRDKMNLHIQKYRKKWIAKETIRVWEEQREEFYPHPVPPWAGEATGNICLKKAKLRVNERIKGRRQQIKTITNAMQTRLIKKHVEYKRVNEKGYAKQEIAVKIHHTLERANALRQQAKSQFEATQKKLMFYTKKHGINGMHERYDKRIEAIERASHSVIRQAFEEYKQPVPQHFQAKTEKSIKKEFNMQM